MERAEKATLVDDFKEALQGAQSVILTEFHGLTVAEASRLRQSCKQQGVHFQVIKNTLARRAIVGTEMEAINDQLVGPTAWAFSQEDPVTPAKVLLQFLKEMGDVKHLSIKGGYLDGRALQAGDVESLSKLPGKDELRSKLLSVFLAPGTQLVRVLVARPVEFLNVLKARAAELEKSAA
jgi:large subunit ribosomal protein L10